MKDVLVLINRRARKGAVDPDALARAFRRRGGRAHIHFPESPERVREIISAQAQGVRAVVIGGGDGSLNAAVEPVIAAGVPMGILPLGTANDLARTLGIPTDLDSAVAIVMRGHAHRVDVGRVNGNLFLNAAHLGLGSRIAANLRLRAKSTWGVPAYVGGSGGRCAATGRSAPRSSPARRA
ncbi:MAG TPA: diacylglycerol kinase family protein [Steroidobacteraceae bacterium]|nr:diacylglycerol kinase family protein [Steroidobacteraceae bacterium]